MAAENRTTLKTYFETGDVPTEAQFANLIDSFHNLPDDGDPVVEADYNVAHSVLVQQTGSGTPVPVHIGNNEILGKSGGGDIDGLTAAQVRTILNVEDGATADQTAAEIKTAYESNADTNAFTDAEQSKLAGIEAGATADQTAAEIKTAYESNADTNAFTDAEQSKLAGIEAGATADQTAAEIKTAYESNADTNAFTDAEQSKLAGVAAGAEVNTIDSDTSGEPTGSDVVPNVVKISQANYDAASSAGTLVATTLYIIT